MLILIAESKTMLEKQTNVSAQIWEKHTPVGETEACRIMNGLERLSQSELIVETGFSATLAAKFRRMIYEFPNKALGLNAIEAYTGVVFRALQFATLNLTEQSLCNENVRIISSLYGFLRPDDIIKPYRLDFSTKAAPGGIALNSFWKKDVTIALVKCLRAQGHQEVLNLLPADAAKCIDWKIVKKFCKVWKADFIEITPGSKPKTPLANKLKTLRGTLLRYILQKDLPSISELKYITTDNLIGECSPDLSDYLMSTKDLSQASPYPDRITFFTV